MACSVPDVNNQMILAEHVAVLHQLGQRIVRDVVEIGRRLSACRAIVGPGNWLSWLDRELKMSDETAYRFIRVAELAANSSHNVVELDLPVSSLYLLAAPSTPETAREEIIERAEAGEKISVAETQRVIQRSKGKAAPKKKPDPPPPAADQRLQARQVISAALFVIKRSVIVLGVAQQEEVCTELHDLANHIEDGLYGNTRRRKPGDGSLFCSFCGKGQHEVANLIKGADDLLICNECVDLFVKIIAEAKAKAAAEPQPTVG